MIFIDINWEIMKEKYAERNKKIIELSESLSQKEIGKIYGITQSAVCLILKRHGIKRKKSRLNMSSLPLNIDFFKNIDTPEKAYWLGYIAADGAINKDNNKLTINCKDLDLLEKFKQDIGAGHKIAKISAFDKRTNKTYCEYSFQVGNELFVKNIIDNGVTHNKTDECFFPKINESLYSFFIAGLFDGDGCVCYVNGKLRCNLISTKEIIAFIDKYLFEKFGIKPCKPQKISQNKPNVYKQYWYKHSIDLLRFLYQGDKKIYLRRKYEIYEKYNEK